MIFVFDSNLTVIDSLISLFLYSILFFIFSFKEIKNSFLNLNYYYMEYKFLYKNKHYSLCCKNTVNLYINLSKIYIKDES